MLLFVTVYRKPALHQVVCSVVADFLFCVIAEFVREKRIDVYKRQEIGIRLVKLGASPGKTDCWENVVIL